MFFILLKILLDVLLKKTRIILLKKTYKKYNEL